MRLLVTGSRTISPQESETVRRVLNEVQAADILRFGHREITVVQGECPYGGVDLIAERWADETEHAQSEGHPADWDGLGKAAGPIRNSYMVSLGADMCLAFPVAWSRGTWDCIRKAVDAGIPTHIYPLHKTAEDGAR